MRFGDAVVQLDADSYRLWRVAAAVLALDGLVLWGVESGISEASELVQDLLDNGLLVELDSLDAEVGSLVAHLLGELVGSPPDEQSGFLVEGRNGATLLVSGVVFEVLLRTSPARTIDEITSQIDVLGAPRHVPPALDATRRALPDLVRREVVVLDRQVVA